jgi:hypothetical protein
MSFISSKLETWSDEIEGGEGLATTPNIWFHDLKWPADANTRNVCLRYFIGGLFFLPSD